jgi:hypothetical protein
MMLVAEGLFRLDVVLEGDTLRSIVRNLSPDAEVRFGPARSSYPIGAGSFGDLAGYEPGNVAIDFCLESATERVDVTGTIATLKFSDRGTTRITVQAVVRLETASA